MGKVSFPLYNVRKTPTGKWDMYHYTLDKKEKIEIPETSDSNGIYSTSLIELPDSGSIAGTTSAPVIDGLKEYRGTAINPDSGRLNFGSGQYWINYSTGEIIFHPSNAGETRYVDYWGRGSLIESDDINNLNDRLVGLETQTNAPSFLTFSITEQPEIMELGQPFPTTPRINFIWSTQFSDGVLPGSIVIRDTTNNTILGQDLNNTGTYTFTYNSKLVYNIPTTVTFQISGKSIIGKDFIKTVSIQWLESVFWGISPDPIVASDQFATFSSKLVLGPKGDYNYSSEGYKVFAHSNNMEHPNYVIDKATRLPIAFLTPQEMLVTNKYGVETPYRFYVSNNKLSSALIVEVG